MQLDCTRSPSFVGKRHVSPAGLGALVHVTGALRGVSALASMFGLVLDFGAVFPAAVLEASAASLSTRLVSHAITGSQIALHPFGQAQRRQVDERCDRRTAMRALQRLFTARELLEQRLALRHAQGIAEHDGAPARLGG